MDLVFANEVNGPRFKYLKNKEGIFRVKILDGSIFRYFESIDLMTMVPGNYKSKILNFSSLEEAKKNVDRYILFKKSLKKISFLKKEDDQNVSDTFEEVK